MKRIFFVTLPFWATGAVLLLFLLAGCASTGSTQPRVKAPKAEARILLSPRIGIANGTVFNLNAVLIDPEGAYQCPEVIWTWPNETQSKWQDDCEPDARETRHTAGNLRRFTLGEGVYVFRVEFKHGKKRWVAEETLEVK